MSLRTRATVLVARVLLPVTLFAARAEAQTLLGSHAAVERAYTFAKRRGIEFNATRVDVQRGVKDGEYVRLRAGSNVRLKGVAMPYVRPTTREFVEDLGDRYRAACKAPMIVTSAIRPETQQRRLRNGVALSVHPTGMAIDLRVPRGKCRSWLRSELLADESAGFVDATEERRPAHFHVIVFRAPGSAN
jgi:hypothetical protein